MRRPYLFLLLAFATTALAQQDFTKIEVKAQKVAGSVYMLTGSGGNIGVSVGEDGTIIVDDQYAPLAPKIEAALKTITDKPVRFILNTHYHGDHTGGNEYFGKSGTIIAQTNVRKRLRDGVTRMGQATPPAPKGALPVITFDESLVVHVNGEDVRAVHMPHGHTDGDAVIYFTASNVVHMGDDYFNAFFPFVDLENGGSVAGMIANVEKVIATIPDDAKVIPGHGALSDKAGLRAYAEMLKATRAAVQQALAAGKSAQQMKDEKVLEPWASWGQGFIKSDRWIDTLVTELSKK